MFPTIWSHCFDPPPPPRMLRTFKSRNSEGGVCSTNFRSGFCPIPLILSIFMIYKKLSGYSLRWILFFNNSIRFYRIGYGQSVTRPERKRLFDQSEILGKDQPAPIHPHFHGVYLSGLKSYAKRPLSLLR